MYSFQKLEILKKLTHEEIIEQGINMGEIRAERFVKTYKLLKEEIELFKNKYQKSINVLDAIAYYQEDDKNVIL